MTALELSDRVRSLERPNSNLLKYYFLCSLVVGPFFPLVLLPAYLRFRTLRYRFDDEGVSMRWGMVFHREISLTYTRIQDIHLASNAVERFFGLGRVLVQTASGASKAEMTIEGLPEFELVRDYLYTRMRGASESTRTDPATRPAQGSPSAGLDGADLEELTVTLRAVAEELAAVRKQLQAHPLQSPTARGSDS